jgi:predicted AlkP superfamily pyrophosphatase or phosphodiesterase
MKTHVHASAPLTDHVVLISIDGLRPNIYRDQRWPAPVLHELALSGAIALNARSVFPALTYPAHATIRYGCTARPSRDYRQ